MNKKDYSDQLLNKHGRVSFKIDFRIDSLFSLPGSPSSEVPAKSSSSSSSSSGKGLIIKQEVIKNSVGLLLMSLLKHKHNVKAVNHGPYMI